MTEGRWVRLSAEQRTEIWRRWKAGESLREIGRAFGKDHGSIQFLLSQRGGIDSKPVLHRPIETAPFLVQFTDVTVEPRLFGDPCKVSIPSCCKSQSPWLWRVIDRSALFGTLS
jgi:hypothetical protein